MTPKIFILLEFWTQNNVPNLCIYENIGVPHPLPGIDTAIGELTTERVSLCTFSIQQTMCAYAKFSYFRKKNFKHIKMFSSKNIETPLSYYHDILCSMSATRHTVLIIFCNTRYKTIFDPSMIFIANSCTSIARYLEILIYSETKYIMKYS